MNIFKTKLGTENLEMREKWLKKILRSIPKGSSIIDVGAGELGYKQYCRHLEYTSQDFCQYDGSGNSEGLQTGEFDTSKIDIVSDITEIPVEAESFDAVMCIEVLEHVPDPVRAIEEMSRILKSGGFMIITAPFCSLTHFAPYHFSTGFNKYFYKKYLEDRGFDIKEITPNGNWYAYIAQELRRLPYMSLKYSNKKMGFMNKLLIKYFVNVLDKLNSVDHGSSELLTYGYDVLAIKK